MTNIPELRLIEDNATTDTTTATVPAPPEDMGEAGTSFWCGMWTDYDFHGETNKVAVLEQACRIVDTIAQLEEAQREAPLTTKGSMGQSVISPYLSEARQQRTALTALLKSLNLPSTEEEAAQTRATKARAGRAGMAARWGK